MKEEHWLIIYDIKDVKRLGKVARLMVKYAHRVQKSVFEMYASISTVTELRKKMVEIIDNDVDYVVYFKLCEPDWQNRLKFGKGRKDEMDDSEVIIL